MRFNEGDVIYCNCVGTEICYHVGIVYKKNNKEFVFHNAPTNVNKYGGSVVSEPLYEFKKNREIYRVVPTYAKNKDIIKVTQRVKYEVWDSMLFNCEDYITEIVQGYRESDIRDTWKMVTVGASLLLLL
jgi:hypothetical protein